MTDRRSPLDFYGAPDTIALARRTGVDAPPPPAPSTFEVFSAARTLAQADLPSADRDRLYDAWQPVIDTLNEGRPWMRRYHNPYAGGDRPELQIFDPDGNFVFKPAARDDAEARLWQAAKANPRTATMLPDSVSSFHDATTKRAKVRIGEARATVGRNDSWLGTAAQLAAGVETSFHDPINIAALPIGGFGSSVAKRLLTSGLANMAVEAIEQPFVAEQREKLGEKLTGAEAAINIGAAGLFGAGMQGVGEAAAPLTRNLVDAARARWGNLTENERVATRVLEREDDVTASSPFEPGAGDDAHLARMEQATREILSQPSRAEQIVPEAVPRMHRPVQAEVAAQRTMADPVERFKARVRRHESGGDDGATNPNSSATGRYQFIDSTWLHYIRQFADAKGMTERGALQMRSHPVWQERVMDAAIRDYRRLLNDVGADETPGNLYLVHFAGEGGAKRILRAADDTPAERLFTPEAIAANPFLRGKDASDVRVWAARAVGEKPSDAPRLRRDIFDTTDEGDAAWQAAQREVDAADAELTRYQQGDGPRIARAVDDEDPLPGFDAFDPPARADADPFAFLDEPRSLDEPAAPRAIAEDAAPPVSIVREPQPGRLGDLSAAAYVERYAEPAGVRDYMGPQEGQAFLGSALIGPDGKLHMFRTNGDRAGWKWEVSHSDFNYAVHPDEATQYVELTRYRKEVALTLPANATAAQRAAVNEVRRQAGKQGFGLVEENPKGIVTAADREEVARQQAEFDGKNRPASADVVRDAAPVSEPAPAPEPIGFADPEDVGADRQMESLEHDLRMFLQEDEAQGLTVRLNDEGDVVSAADALIDLDDDDAAIAAAQACMVPPTGAMA